MSNYSYEAVDAGGLKIQGTIDVLDQNEALRRIKEMGLFPVKLSQARTRWQRAAVVRRKTVAVREPISITIPYFGTRVKSRYVTVFTRQLPEPSAFALTALSALFVLKKKK